MDTINTKLFDVLKDFDTISLEELNATMSLMERIEKKYMISLNDLGKLMKEFYKDYYILAIKGNSIFTYDNIYMDTKDFLFFHQHESGQKNRMKVRSREYVDSNLAFFECKQREGDVIRKSRYGLPVEESKVLTNQSAAFYENVCTSLDLEYAHENLQPTLRTLYKRVTLCSKKNDERITIDFDIRVQDVTQENAELIPFGPIAIIETKSSRKKSKSHDTIEALGYKEARGCSKYCLGMLYAGHIGETKRFKATMKFIEKANKPKQKVHNKTTQQLTNIKQDIIADIKKPVVALKKNKASSKQQLTPVA